MRRRNIAHSIGIAVGYTNGRKDPKFRYSVKYTPDKAEEAIKEMQGVLKNMKNYAKRVKANPELFDLTREKM